MSTFLKPDLPVLTEKEKIIAELQQNGRLILSAPPGSGKSTQVPQFFLQNDVTAKILVLQPRRIAARNLAYRIAEEIGEPLGQRIGYQVRFESKLQASTQVIFQTYGVFFQQLLQKPTLENIRLVIFDEFHERTLEADASLAWVRSLREVLRPDLKFIVMSATLEHKALQNYLGCTILDIPGRMYPVEIIYQAPNYLEHLGLQVLRAVKKIAAQGTEGSILIFLPGQGEIRKTWEALDVFCREQTWPLFELHGSMDVEAQQRTLCAPQKGTCVILTTNVAETSLTIPGVTAVIDSGLARHAAYNAERDVNTLYLGMISQHNAVQRAGRAGRTAPGFCIRLWAQERDKQMPEALDPEIQKLDLTSMRLSLNALWGKIGSSENTNPNFWLTAPKNALWDKAGKTLLQIGALDKGNITATGLNIIKFPVHPALAKVLHDSVIAEVPEIAAAMIAVMESQSRNSKGNRSDLFTIGLEFAQDPKDNFWERDMREAYQQLRRLLRLPPEAGFTKNNDPQMEKRWREKVTSLFLSAFPDRIAVRQEKSNSFILADGRKGAIQAQAVPPLTQIILAMDLHETGGANQSRQVGIPLLLPCESNWVETALAQSPEPCQWIPFNGWDEVKKKAVHEEQLKFRELILDRRPLRESNLTSEQIQNLLVERLIAGDIKLQNYTDEVEQLVFRIQAVAKAFPEYGVPKMDEEDWKLIYHELCEGKRSAKEVEEASVQRVLQEYLGQMHWDLIQKMAPVSLKLASGKMGKLTWFENAAPEVSARLGDFIGMQGKLTVLGGKVDVVYDILAPNYRTVQKTNDISSFWKNTYPEVKKELQRRYPRHPWP